MRDKLRLRGLGSQQAGPSGAKPFPMTTRGQQTPGVRANLTLSLSVIPCPSFPTFPSASNFLHPNLLGFLSQLMAPGGLPREKSESSSVHLHVLLSWLRKSSHITHQEYFPSVPCFVSERTLCPPFRTFLSPLLLCALQKLGGPTMSSQPGMA